jgi:putative transposase
MTRAPQTVAFWRGQLPHWEVEEGRYFVTICLDGAIPATGRERIRQLAAELTRVGKGNPSDELKRARHVFQEMERWLDSLSTVDYLLHPQIAELVMEAINHRNRDDWTMYEYVLMPNHVHLFFELKRPGLKKVLEEFKRWTGHCAIKMLQPKTSRFWQDEWFDHWSRSDDEDHRIVEYIRQNPVKAGLVNEFTEWRWGSWNPT